MSDTWRDEPKITNPPELPQQHHTIIEEPPFPPPSQLDITATTADDSECPNTQHVPDDNNTSLSDNARLQQPNNIPSRSNSVNTVHATMVRNETLRVVTADCVPEAMPLDTSTLKRKKLNINLGNRKTQIVLFSIMVVIVALAVGIGVAVSSKTDRSKSSSSSATTEQPSSSPTAAPMWIQVGQDLTGTKEFESFGFSSSISKDGRRVAVGSPLYYDTIGNSTAPVEVGRVLIFDEDSEGEYWSRAGEILGHDAYGQLGVYTTFSGDGSRIAIGANNASQTGRVDVFGYNKMISSWERIGEPIIGDAIGSNFGTCVAFSNDGTILAVSANSHDDGVNSSDVGLVRIFEYLNGSWIGMGEDILGEGPGDRSGHRISMSDDGRVIAIGAHHNDGENRFGTGHVRVYQYSKGENGATWEQMGQDIDGERKLDRFGWSVSLSGDGSILAAGARRSDGGGIDSGGVWIYEYNNEADKWNVSGRMYGETSGDSLGHEVSLSRDGSVVAISGINHDGINGDDSGYVQIYRYHRQRQEWTKVGGNIYGKSAGDEFGSSVSVSADGTRVVIGASFNDDAGVDSGMVQIYEMMNSSEFFA